MSAEAKMVGGVFSNTEIGPSAAVSSDVGGGYSETPTITYTPVRGEQSAKKLLAEINLGELVLLARGGCDMDIVMRMLVKEIAPPVLLQNTGLRPRTLKHPMTMTTLWSLSPF